MSYKPQSLFRLIEDINSSLYLPHIQRPFVWSEDQMRKLFDSLMRSYPVQTFLFWRTKDAIKARKFMDSIEWDADLHDYYDANKSAKDVEKVFVLDGQQRLQTLYALFNGAIKSPDGTTDLEAYIDLTSGSTIRENGLLYDIKFFASDPGLPYYRLRNLRTSHAKRNAEEIADEVNDYLDAIPKDGEADEERKARQKRVRSNCAQISALLKQESYFWIEELDGTAEQYPYKKVLDIFVRVNSGGTKLDASDLMFAAMKEGWANVEENIENVVEMLNGSGELEFDKTFPLKCLSVVHGKGAELKPESFSSAEGEALLKAIEDNWEHAEETFRQLRDFITNDVQIYSDKTVRSYVSFVPLFDYLYFNPKPDEANRILMRAYYYKSQLFNWYSSQTDTIVNVLHNRVGKALTTGFPLEDIKAYFRDSRHASVELQRSDLSDIRLRFIILNMVYVASHGTSPFNVRFKGNEPHIDHIYPKSALRDKLKLPTTEINTIGNYRFVGASENLRKRAELPDSYFARLKSLGVNIFTHLLLAPESNDPALLKFDVDTYRAFRERRVDAILAIGKQVVNPEVK